MKLLLAISLLANLASSLQEVAATSDNTASSCSIQKIDSNAIITSCYVNSEILPDGEEAKIECKLGYYLNTSSTTITCRNGILDAVQCVPGCPPPGKRNNSQLINSVKKYYDIGETVSYTCDEGYFSWEDYRNNQFNITCQRDSTWSNDKVADCSSPNAFSTVAISVTSEAKIRVECDLNVTDIQWLQNGENYMGHGGHKLIIQQLPFPAPISGFYICTGVVNNRLHVGKRMYNVIGEHGLFQCGIKRVDKFYFKAEDGENVLIKCPYFNCDGEVRVQWFKDNDEISNSKFRQIIPSTGLFLSNVTTRDDGTYTCQLPREKTILNFTLSVTPSVESICGKKIFYNSKHARYQPWLAVLYHNSDKHEPFCYGTLLNKEWVVTSGFCLETLRRKEVMESVTVHLNTNKKIFPIAKIVVHPLYTQHGTANNIGLIKLRRQSERDQSSVNFSNDVLPACISSDDIGGIHECESFGDLRGTVVGWGDKVDMFDAEKMRVVSKEICQKSSKLGFAKDKFCAVFDGKDESFVGDSGSPFLVYYREKTYLLGIYTFGQRDTDSGMYDYFTSIFYHYDWIKNTISKPMVRH